MSRTSFLLRRADDPPAGDDRCFPSAAGPHYRCKLAAEYALANKVEHPKTVYVREDRIETALDEQLSGIFGPEHLDETCQLLATANARPEITARIEGARRLLADLDARLAKLTAAIEAGAPDDLLVPRLQQLRSERLRADAELQAAKPAERWTAEKVRALVESLGNVAAELGSADRKQKAHLYEEMGLELQFDPDRNLVVAEVAIPCTGSVSEGGLEHTPVPF